MTRYLTLCLILIFASCGTETSQSETRSKAPASEEKTETVEKTVDTSENALLPPEELITNKHRAIAILKALENSTGSVFRENVDNALHVQHDPTIKDGMAGYKGLTLKYKESGITVDVIRALQMGNFAITHSVFNSEQPQVGFDIFRFEKGKLQEHWSGKQDMAENNISGHSQVDGELEVVEVNKTGVNMKLVQNYLNNVVMAGDWSKKDVYVNSDYTEHSPYSQDGSESLIKLGSFRERAGKSLSYTEIKNVYGEGNFVLVQSSGQENSKDVVIYDLFRLSDNKISEHWEVISEIPSKDQWVNKNGPF